jgi:hypothetical protein
MVVKRVPKIGTHSPKRPRSNVRLPGGNESKVYRCLARPPANVTQSF